jgi:hypothetical protein
LNLLRLRADSCVGSAASVLLAARLNLTSSYTSRYPCHKKNVVTTLCTLSFCEVLVADPDILPALSGNLVSTCYQNMAAFAKLGSNILSQLLAERYLSNMTRSPGIFTAITKSAAAVKK